MGIFNKSYRLYFSEELYKEFYSAFLAVFGGDYDTVVTTTNPVDGQKIDSTNKTILFEHELHGKVIHPTAIADKVSSMEALSNLITLRNYCQVAFSRIEHAIKSNAYSYKRVDNDRQLFDITDADYTHIDAGDVSMMLNNVPSLDDIPCLVVANQSVDFFNTKCIGDVALGIGLHIFGHYQKTGKGKEFYIKVDNSALETIQYNYKKFLARTDAIIDACLGRAGKPIADEYSTYANVRTIQCHPFEKITHGSKFSRKDVLATSFSQYTI